MNLTFPPSEYPNGLCPFMSGQVVPVGSSAIVRGTAEIAVSPVFVPCAGSQCQMWAGEGCALRHDFLLNRAQSISTSLQNLEPPKAGSPIMALVQAVESFAVNVLSRLDRLIEVTDRRK